MATRFYLPSTGNSAVSVTDSAVWDGLADNFVSRAAVVAKISSAMATISLNGNSDTNDTDYIYGQWVSAPITAQTISAQTFKAQIRAMEEHARCNQYISYSIRVVSNDGATVRGTIYEGRDGTELAVSTTTFTNRGHSATTTQVVCSANDRIVIEIGTGGNPATGAGGNSHDSDLRIGDASGSDLPENDTDTNDYCPWVEFPNTITFSIPDPITVSLDAAGISATAQTLILVVNRTVYLDAASIVSAGQNCTFLYQVIEIEIDFVQVPLAMETILYESEEVLGSIGIEIANPLTISWDPIHTVFDYSTVYTISFNVTPSTNYEISASATVLINGEYEGSIVFVSGNTWTISCEFPATYPSIQVSAAQISAIAQTGSIFSEVWILLSLSTISMQSPDSILYTYDISMIFGEENPTNEEHSISWQTWEHIDGSHVDIIGDEDWGLVRVFYPDDEIRSMVYDTGNTDTKKLIIEKNHYSDQSTGFLLDLRGSSSVFERNDESPAWENYTEAMDKDWRYLQLRVRTS